MEEENLVKGHRGNLRYYDSAKSIGDGWIDSDKIKLDFLIIEGVDGKLELIFEVGEVEDLVVVAGVDDLCFFELEGFLFHDLVSTIKIK